MGCVRPSSPGTDGPVEVYAQFSEPGQVVCDTAQSARLLDGTPWAASVPGPAVTRTGNAVAAADLDGDGLLEILVPHRDTLEIWSPGLAWRHDVLATGGVVNALAVVDIDGDGDLDVDVGGDLIRGIVHNDDGVYRYEAGTEDTMVTSLAWADIDGDGELDRVVGAFGDLRGVDLDRDDMPFDPNRVETATGNLALAAELRNGLTYVLAPLDADGDHSTDLYAVNDFGHQHLGNALALGPSLTLEPSAAIVANGMGLAVGDLDWDGLPELFMTGWYNHVLLSNDGTGAFYESTLPALEALLDRNVSWGADFGDVDNDGDLDLYVAYGQLPDSEPLEGHEGENPAEQPDVLLLNEGGIFVDRSAEWGLHTETPTRGALLVDIDGDGFLDILRGDLNGRGQLLYATCDDSAWLSVETRQGGSNRRAVGARVEVVTPEKTYTDWIRSGGRSLASSGPPRVHVGLADQDEVLLRVIWPDGGVSEQQVSTRQNVVVERD